MYTALVVALDSNYQDYHEPESLELYKALSRFNTNAAIYLLDYTLPQVAKLSKTLQIKEFDLPRISSLVDPVLVSLDDAITPATNWVLKLLDSKDDLQQATGKTISADKIHTFQKKVGIPFIVHLKENVSNQFASHDIV